MLGTGQTHRTPLLIGGLIILLTAVAFSDVPSFQLLRWDDDIELTENVNVQALSWPNVKWMLTDTSVSQRYVPLSWLVWALIFHAWQLTPWPYHFEALLLHIANSVLVFLVLRRILQHTLKNASDSQAWIFAGIGAGFWALHPLRVEVVAWVTQVRYARSTLFSLLAVLFYLQSVSRSAQRPYRTRAFWLSALMYALSLGFYPLNIGLPAVFVVMDIYPLRRSGAAESYRRIGGYLLEKIPFLICAVLFGAMAVHGRLSAEGGWTPATLGEFSLAKRAVQACYIITYYLWRPFYLQHFSAVYCTLIQFEPWDVPFLFSAIVVIGCSLMAVVFRRRFPAFTALWCCHLALILPAGGYFERPHFPSDRYSYLQGVLLSLAVIALLDWLHRRAARRISAVVWTSAVIVILICARKSYLETDNWRDSETLFRHILREMGSDPYQATIHWRLGEEYVFTGRLYQTIAECDKTLSLQPSNSHALYYKAVALTEIADREYDDQDPSASQRLYRAAGSLCGRSFKIDATPEAVLLYSTISDRLGQLSEADGAASAGVRHFPEYTDLYIQLGQVRYEQGKPAEAISILDQAIRLDPNLAPRRQPIIDHWKELPARHFVR